MSLGPDAKRYEFHKASDPDCSTMMTLREVLACSFPEGSTEQDAVDQKKALFIHYHLISRDIINRLKRLSAGLVSRRSTPEAQRDDTIVNDEDPEIQRRMTEKTAGLNGLGRSVVVIAQPVGRRRSGKGLPRVQETGEKRKKKLSKKRGNSRRSNRSKGKSRSKRVMKKKMAVKR